jgi:DNA ligase-1
MKYFESIEDARGKLNLKPMLANKYGEHSHKITYPVDVQPKLNGYRCNAYMLPDGSIRLMSRGGKDYTLPHISDGLKGRLKDGRILDGELYIHGKSLQTISHLIKKLSRDSEEVQYHLYDNFWRDQLHMPWRERVGHLTDWIGRNPDDCRVSVDTSEAHSEEFIETLHDQYVRGGYEGAIVRTWYGGYRLAARSSDLLKFKKFLDGEFEVVGHKIGRDGVVVFECIQEEGLPFYVRPEGSEEERARMLAEAPGRIGQKLTVRFKDRSDVSIPQHLVGVAFRGDEDL